MNAKEIVFLAALLLAGTAMQYFISPLQLLLTPDVITAFFCLGIILVRPRMREALVIGLAGGFLSMLIPGSILPWANLASGTAGGYACYYLYELFRDGRAGPLATAFGATLVSGFVFVAVVSAVLFGTILSRFGDFPSFMAVYLPIIIGTALLNGFIVEVLVLLYQGGEGKERAAAGP